MSELVQVLHKEVLVVILVEGSVEVEMDTGRVVRKVIMVVVVVAVILEVQEEAPQQQVVVVHTPYQL